MARIRTTKPEFWTSEQVVECSRDARLLFIGLWNFCDDAGRHPASAKRIKMLVLPADDVTTEEVATWLNELINVGLLNRYVVDGKEFVEVTGWSHQRIEKPTIKYPPNPNSNENSTTILPPIAEPSTTILPRSGVERSVKGVECKVDRTSDQKKFSEGLEQAIVSRVHPHTERDAVFIRKVASAVRAGKIPEGWAMSAAEGTRIKNPRKPVAYFTTLLKESCDTGKVDFAVITSQSATGPPAPKVTHASNGLAKALSPKD